MVPRGVLHFLLLNCVSGHRRRRPRVSENDLPLVSEAPAASESESGQAALHCYGRHPTGTLAGMATDLINLPEGFDIDEVELLDPDWYEQWSVKWDRRPE